MDDNFRLCAGFFRRRNLAAAVAFGNIGRRARLRTVICGGARIFAPLPSDGCGRKCVYRARHHTAPQADTAEKEAVDSRAVLNAGQYAVPKPHCYLARRQLLGCHSRA